MGVLDFKKNSIFFIIYNFILFFDLYEVLSVVLGDESLLHLTSNLKSPKNNEKSE